MNARNQRPSQLDLPVRDHKAAIIVGVAIPSDNLKQIEDDLNELEALLVTLGVEPKARIVQRRQKFTPQCLLGTGKAEEIGVLAKIHGATMVVVDQILSPPQVRNLELLTGCAVTDRSGVILEIFAKHARSNQAKTQVEIARLQYLLPRMAGAWTHLERQTGGGVNSKGMGETQIEVDRRRARDKIARLQRTLEQIRKEKQIQRKARRNELKVALVGYTNTGKSTVMNALTRSDMLAKDALFATLESSVRTISPISRPRILMSDTVGFIRKLPHGLVESFRSTLDEVLEADHLLHMVDASHPNYKEQMAATQLVLEEIGAADLPQIIVFNKFDRVDDPFLPRILKHAYKGSICISAQSPQDLIRLREHIHEFFTRHMITARVAIQHTDQDAMSLVYNNCLILDSDFETAGQAIFHIQTTQSSLALLRPYLR